MKRIGSWRIYWAPRPWRRWRLRRTTPSPRERLIFRSFWICGPFEAIRYRPGRNVTLAEAQRKFWTEST